MSSNRFYLRPDSSAAGLDNGREIELPEETSRQVLKVLRMQQGDRLTLFDGSGSECPAEIVSVQKNSVTALLGDAIDPGTEPSLHVTIYQALVPAERMEFVIQKSTELGASRVVPILTERVQARDSAISKNKRARWERIAIEAAEQSGRTRVPEIGQAISFSECLAVASAEGSAIMLWEDERMKTLKQAVQESLAAASKHMSVLIGPVGGLSVAEADAGRSAGAILAGAGARILRAETAPLVALTAIMYEAGELGMTGKARAQ